MRSQSFLMRSRQGYEAVSAVGAIEAKGRVGSLTGLSMNIVGLGNLPSKGDRFSIRRHGYPNMLLEVLGFQGTTARAMSFDSLEGVGSRSEVQGIIRSLDGTVQDRAELRPCSGWLGRVIDPLGNAVDGRGAMPIGPKSRDTRASPPAATCRDRLGPRIDLGVGVLNLFTTCRTGQRLGLFAGSGVGKSTLLAMLARHTACDVAVLALVGERGREVREFIEDDLGSYGLSRSVVVTATSDSSPMLRREAAYTAMTVAEHFRDDGKSVLLLMDSITRFCSALREIGLSIGEPQATRGYPPSVFTELPRLVERAGPGPFVEGKAGHITAIFTVLVEGDDHNEPVADAVRGFIDGHIVLDRKISEAGRFPAVDVLRSLSRTVPGCLEPQEQQLVARARALLCLYAEVADLVRLGAYKSGLDPEVDEAVRLAPRIQVALHQSRGEAIWFDRAFEALGAILEEKDG